MGEGVLAWLISAVQFLGIDIVVLKNPLELGRVTMYDEKEHGLNK